MRCGWSPGAEVEADAAAVMPLPLPAAAGADVGSSPFSISPDIGRPHRPCLPSPFVQTQSENRPSASALEINASGIRRRMRLEWRPLSSAPSL